MGPSSRRCRGPCTGSGGHKQTRLFKGRNALQSLPWYFLRIPLQIFILKFNHQPDSIAVQGCFGPCRARRRRGDSGQAGVAGNMALQSASELTARLPQTLFTRFTMQEILTAATYLVVWLLCEHVLEIESGLIKLIISLGAAVSIYVIIAVRDCRTKRDKVKGKD